MWYGEANWWQRSTGEVALRASALTEAVLRIGPGTRLYSRLTRSDIGAALNQLIEPDPAAEDARLHLLTARHNIARAAIIFAATNRIRYLPPRPYAELNAGAALGQHNHDRIPASSALVVATVICAALTCPIP